MPTQSPKDINLEHFDDLFVGDPSEIEKNLKALLPRAQALENKSLYLQILSHIALAEAMQKKFDEAHKTLDHAQANITSAYPLAHVRILLERGRTFHQSDNVDEALPLFKKSYELSQQHAFDFHTINAAHMIAIVVKNIEEKIAWNKVALELAIKTDDSRARLWLGALYNNLAQNYIEAEQYENALQAFQNCQKHGEERGDAIIIRGAQWGIARSLRSLGKLDEALNIQHGLVNEYNEIAQNKSLPYELIVVG